MRNTIYYIAAVILMQLPIIYANDSFVVSCPDYIDLKIERKGANTVEGGCSVTPSVTVAAARAGWAPTNTSKSTHVCQVGIVNGTYQTAPADKATTPNPGELVCRYSFGGGYIIDSLTREIRKYEAAGVKCVAKGKREFTCTR